MHVNGPFSHIHNHTVSVNSNGFLLSILSVRNSEENVIKNMKDFHHGDRENYPK